MGIVKRTFFKSKKVQDALSQQHKIITIGVMGTKFGVGVTHLCILLGTFFSHSRGKVALVEWKNQDAFSNIQEAYDGINVSDLSHQLGPGIRRSSSYAGYLNHDQDSLPEQPFLIKKIAYFKQYNQPSLSALKDGSYQFIVVDFGEFTEGHMHSFNEMDIKLLVGHTNEWKYKEIQKIMNQYPKTMHQQWKLVLPFASTDEIKVLSRSFHNKMYPLSFYKDPFIYDEAISNEIEQILQR